MARRLVPPQDTSDSKWHRSTPLVKSPSRCETGASLGWPVSSRSLVDTAPTTPAPASPGYEDGGVPLETPHTPLRGTARILSALSPTPINEANTGRRRANHGSMLSQSPARPGHCSRMKQIFEEIGKSSTPSFDYGRVQYPQLPDISLHSSPRDVEEKHPFALPDTVTASPNGKVLSLSPIVKPTSATSAPLYGNGSESWSDDSGYINAESFAHKSVETAKDRVQVWLSAVSGGNDDDDTDSKPHRSSRSSSPDNDMEKHARFSVASSKTSGHTAPLAFRHRGYAPADPFVSLADDNNLLPEGGTNERIRPTYRVPPTTSKVRKVSDTGTKMISSFKTSSTNSLAPKRLPNPELGLSLLSPNVCIERGTSQRPFKTISTQQTFTSAAYAIRESSKENLAAEAEALYSSKMWQNLSPTVYPKARSARYPQDRATEAIDAEEDCSRRSEHE